MLGLISNGTITNAAAKIVFEEMFRTGAAPDVIVADKGLAQMSDQGELEATVRRVLERVKRQLEMWEAADEAPESGNGAHA